MKYLFEFSLLLLIGCGVPYVLSNESCWIHEDICNVRAEIFQNLELSNGIAMQIDCLVNVDETKEDQIKNNDTGDLVDIVLELSGANGGGDGGGEGGGIVADVGSLDHHHHHQSEQTPKSASYLLWHRRFMGVQAVILDGCQTPLNTHTYGLEFLPICANVTKVSLQHFHMDSLKPLECSQGDGGIRDGDTDHDDDFSSDQQLELEYLHLQFNEITSIEDQSFQGHYPHLRVLELQSNSLKVIQAKAFLPLRSLEHLKIVNEPVLILKFPDIFEFTAAITIHLVALRQMTSEIFRHLPETLQTLYVADTPLVSDAGDSDAVVVALNNARTLSNLTIINCSLEKFTLRDVHSTVKSINLNGNTLKSFEAYENQLKELDLSSNHLEHFDFAWLVNLTVLERLALKGNHMKVLSLYELMQSIPSGHFVDLRENHLQSLQDEDRELPSWLTSHMRLKCDQNPWDCLWLHEFAHSYPEKFRLLQYEKFISKINVNGLQCIPAEKPLEKPSEHKQMTELPKRSDETVSAPESIANVSSFTVIYSGGEQWEFKRNQRAEALIIVFMLPLGIAFLFLLLYMWIYCQKMFHLSYYKNFSCVQKTPTVPNPSQRFDVVRQIPPGQQQNEQGSPRPLTFLHEHEDGGGYEVPLHGMCSECNCKSLANAKPDKCQKAIHITYEESPQDIPHQIYEEIISVDDHFDQSQQHHVHYDHLTFD